jgi:hypothetical protein
MLVGDGAKNWAVEHKMKTVDDEVLKTGEFPLPK